MSSRCVSGDRQEQEVAQVSTERQEADMQQYPPHWMTIRDFLPNQYSMPGVLEMAVEQQISVDGVRNTFYNVPDRCTIKTIIQQEMDGIVEKWLEPYELDHHIWFFNGLSYNELGLLNMTNSLMFLNKVKEHYDNLNVHISEDEIKELKSDLKEICTLSNNLFERPYKLRFLLTTLEVKIPISEFLRYLCIIESILPYPVPNKYCTSQKETEQPQHDLYMIMRKACKILMTHVIETNILIAKSDLVLAIKQYTICTNLIKSNQLYFKYQVDGVLRCAGAISKIVKKKKRDFSIR